MFLLPDELFVSEAYARVLRRPADPAGYLSYLRALRKGRLSRAALVADLHRSEEARLADARGPLEPTWFTAPDLWPAHRPQRLSGWRSVRPSDARALPPDSRVEACTAGFLGRHATLAERQQAAAQASSATDGATATWAHWKAQSTGHRRFAPFGWFAEPLTTRPEPGAKAAPCPDPATGPDFTGTTGGLPQPALAGAGPAPNPLGAAERGRTPHRAPPACPSGTVFFTIATRSYLPQVRVLMRSLARQHPEATRLLLLVDDAVPAELGAADDPWVTVPVDELGLEGLDDMALRYDVLELCTAVKPFFFQWLLGAPDVRRMVYLDPDIQCHAPLDEALDALDRGHSAVLTPHITEPLPPAAVPDDHVLLRSGSFNLGFAAFGRSTEAQRFLAWWAGKLRTQCLSDFAANLFTDQRWCDFAPSFLPGLHVWRHPGANLAYWNLATRQLEGAGDGWSVNGQPLIFIHFSGLDPTRPDRFSRYQEGGTWDAQPGLAALTVAYADELLRAGWRQARGVTCRFAQIDGVPWVALLRRQYRQHHGQPGAGNRAEALERAQVALCTPRPDNPLSDLMRLLHGCDADLQKHFDLESPAGRSGYEGWFWSTGVAAHGLVPLARRARDRAPARPGPSLRRAS